MSSFALSVVQTLRDAGFVALWAGGCVRDLLLDQPAKDYDIATDATPEAVRDLFGKKRTLAVGASFGVMIVLGPDRQSDQVEVATFRTEGEYTDGRRPDSVVFCSPDEDAARRDFTINGMFYDPIEERLIDYVGGEADLRAGVIRAIGDPFARISEDKLRMLRAVRFTARMQFRLDEATADAVRSCAPQIHVVSAERIADELRKMLADPHRNDAIALLLELDLLPQILPEVDAKKERWPITLEAISHLRAASFEQTAAVLLEAVLPETARRMARRLRLSNAEADTIGWLLSHQEALRMPQDLALHQLKPLLSHRNAGALLANLRARLLAEQRTDEPVVFCENYLAASPRENIDPPALLTGNELISLGFSPGPQFKQILQKVREAQLDERISTRQEALEIAKTAANETE